MLIITQHRLTRKILFRLCYHTWYDGVIPTDTDVKVTRVEQKSWRTQ
jgi:hypothetical protein